jgi:hypothetical protein
MSRPRMSLQFVIHLKFSQGQETAKLLPNTLQAHLANANISGATVTETPPEFRDFVQSSYSDFTRLRLGVLASNSWNLGKRKSSVQEASLEIDQPSDGYTKPRLTGKNRRFPPFWSSTVTSHLLGFSYSSLYREGTGESCFQSFDIRTRAHQLLYISLFTPSTSFFIHSYPFFRQVHSFSGRSYIVFFVYSRHLTSSVLAEPVSFFQIDSNHAFPNDHRRVIALSFSRTSYQHCYKLRKKGYL